MRISRLSVNQEGEESPLPRESKNVASVWRWHVAEASCVGVLRNVKVGKT